MDGSTGSSRTEGGQNVGMVGKMEYDVRDDKKNDPDLILLAKGAGFDAGHKEQKYPPEEVKLSAREKMKQVCEMVNLMGTPILERVLECRMPIDTVLSCSDGKIGAHRIVLTAVSPYMGMMFEDHKLGEVTTVILPDIRRVTMETLLHLAYTGRMIFPPEMEDEVFAAMECLLFGQTAQLELSMVRVKKIEPPPAPKKEPKPSTSGSVAGPSASSSSSAHPTSSSSAAATANDIRKRRLSGASDSQSSQRANCKKKPKYDQNGQPLQVARRTGNPIGKEGAERLKKRREKRVTTRGLNIVTAPPTFTSNPETKTVRINMKKLPFVSIRLDRVGGPVLIEQTDKRRPRYLGKTKQQNSRPDSRPSSRNSATSSEVATTHEKIKGSGSIRSCDKRPSSPPLSTIDDSESGFAEAETVDSSSSSAADSCESDDRSIPNSPPSSPEVHESRHQHDENVHLKARGKTIRLRSGMLCLNTA